jgi:hypothetical protein
LTRRVMPKMVRFLRLSASSDEANTSIDGVFQA